MSCPDGTGFQCSGASIVVAGDVAATDFGVQAYARSTSDLAARVSDPTTATGFQPDAGGTTEIRLGRNSSGAVSRVAVLLSNLKLLWDGKVERPTIVETFEPTPGRVVLDDDPARLRALKFLSLPASTNTGFYDFATKGTAGTQSNYANNRYFPRGADNPPRCVSGATSCPTTETDGLQYQAGDWRSGGNSPDQVHAVRLHEDGDIHAGNTQDGGVLPGGTGTGAPFPGSKGYRSFTGLSFEHANLGAWFTQDTVLIAEWTGADGSREHSKNRRGIVAYGALSNPALVPTKGNASYSGTVYGWYAANKDADPSVFRGTASVSVNFATREAVVTIKNTDGGTIPASFTATTTLGAASGTLANYLSGTASNDKLSGKVSGRYFGPLTTTGTSGQGPAETGGAFSLSNSTTGEAIVGGFIARKQ